MNDRAEALRRALIEIEREAQYVTDLGGVSRLKQIAKAALDLDKPDSNGVRGGET